MKKTVLIVEDEEDILRVYENILKKEDFKVFTATNGIEGVDLASKHNPDVILLDILMPEMDGITALKEMRDKLCTSKVILLTASPTLRLNEGIELGIFAYLNKAISTPKEIVQLIKHAVNLK
jgi:two-component system, OmpR family, alkaline phosphatase synthesis response regulator PhoP